MEIPLIEYAGHVQHPADPALAPPVQTVFPVQVLCIFLAHNAYRHAQTAILATQLIISANNVIQVVSSVQLLDQKTARLAAWVYS